jgi:caffeoyl-CoA O-methyltransferase
VIVRPVVEDYAERHSSPPPGYLLALADETHRVSSSPHMMVGPLEGRLLAMLVHAVRPRTVLELGTFTGYSALAMAPALPAGARIVSCEMDPVYAEIARRHIAASPWADRIEILLGDALGTIAGLEGPFEFVFVDADKTRYSDYLDAVLPKLGDSGLIAVDNTLHLGRVPALGDRSEEMIALRAFNEKVRDDPRLEQVILTVRDGLTLIRLVD